jgi:hypothetical protein
LFGFFGILPELFSRLFYVAASRLNSPRLSVVVYTPAESRLSSNKATYQTTACGLPPHSAERLRLSDSGSIGFGGGYASRFAGVASKKSQIAERKGEAFPHCAAASRCHLTFSAKPT